jgi:hypothetical protein
MIKKTMVKEIFFSFFCISLFLFFGGCVVDKFDSRLKFINNTNTPLLVYGDFFSLNDTLINCDGCYTNNIDDDYYNPKDTAEIGLHGKLYDEYLIKNPNQIFRIFVFASDTIKKYGWEKAKNDYLILKRYDVNLEYIKKHKWVITYPDPL